tara:strand:- start:3446 stop:3982 length:537 start_codon:yes stop_codon:yes gene_type:complete
MIKLSQKITDNQTESMIYQLSYQKLIITLTIGIIFFIPPRAHAETKFELKKSKPKETQTAQPLFDLLNSDPPSLKPANQTDNKWGNNPFFKQQKTIKIPEKKAAPEVSQSLDLYEYKVSAIWKVNNGYKALVSGHIVQKGDKINEVTIDKITEKDISVIRKGKKRSFRLGSIFYDFQI